MNSLILELAVVFTPGLIWTAMVDALCVVAEKRSLSRTVARAFGFGLGSYLIYFALVWLWSRVCGGPTPTVFQRIVMPQSGGDLSWIGPRDVLFASLWALSLSVAWSWLANRNIFFLLMRKLRVTRKFGNESLWEYWLTRADATSEYVNCRDSETKLTFAGFVRAYAGTAEHRELVLEQVRVFDSESDDFFYETPRVYLCRKSGAIQLEFPMAPATVAGGQSASAHKAAGAARQGTTNVE
jgi:hypothetical protein